MHTCKYASIWHIILTVKEILSFVTIVYNMREVEIKIKLKDFKSTINNLKRQGCKFSKKITQEDWVYIPKNEPKVPVPFGVNVLRIRKQDEEYLFTLKISDKHNHLSKEEVEIKITEPIKVQKIIKLLGFKLIAIVKKQRIKCKFEGFEICLDRISGLGDFMEVEKITNKNPLEVQQEMIQLLRGLGIIRYTRIKVGYDVLVFRKRK